MPHNRFYSESCLNKGETVYLEDKEFHHLVHVMRSNVGDQLELIDGKGTLAIGTITRIEKSIAHVNIRESTHIPVEDKKLILALALQTHSHLEYAIEKAVELHASEIRIFQSDTSSKGFQAKYFSRLHTLAIAATKQCGRLYLPTFSYYPSIENIPKSTLDFFCDLDHGKSIHEYADIIQQAKEIQVYIGPEGGFSKKEQLFFLNNAYPLSLSKNILRAETAASTACALIGSYFF